MRFVIAVIALLLITGSGLQAATIYDRVDVVSVYDGDTFTADVEIWPRLTHRVSVRIIGIDTPELRSKCQAEKDMARAARQRLEALLSADAVVLTDVRLGKFAGRVLAKVLTPAGDVSAILIAEGIARPYHGGRRQPWC